MGDTLHHKAGAAPRQASGILPLTRGCLKLLRWKQWVKNGFVLAPLVFAGKLVHSASVQAALWTFLSFSLLTSAVYVMNDWLDRKEDRLHPGKRQRPIASGVVSGTAASVLGAAVFLLAMALAWLKANPAVLSLELAYVALNVAYSLYLKHVVIVDVFSIAIGFVIRVWAGAYAIAVSASHWAILCALLLALFLGFSKRRSELGLLDGGSAGHRSVLASYSAELIEHMNLIVCSATVVCYILYTVSPETIVKFGSDRLVYSVPFVIYGLFRYLFLVERRAEGASPSDLLFRDRPLLVCVLAWLSYCLVFIYGFGKAGL